MNLFRPLLMVVSFTLLSRITGLFREILIAREFGANQLTDAFYIAFRIPNLLRRLFAEGAFSQAFIPVLSEFKKKHSYNSTKELVDAVSTVLFWILVLLSVFGVSCASWIVYVVASGLYIDGQSFLLTVEMTRIIFPYIIFISMTTLATSILNTYKHFSLPAFSPVLLNISCIIALVFITPIVKIPMIVLSWAVIFGGVLQFIIQIPVLKKIGMMPTISLNPLRALFHPGVKPMLINMVPTIFSISVAQFLLIINTNIASHLGPGAVSWINYADRLMEFPSALLGVAISTILLPTLSKASVNEDWIEYSGLLDWGLRLTFLFSVPSAISLSFFAYPITAVLFDYGKFDRYTITMVAYALSMYGIGLIGIIMIKILAPGFYAKRDIKTPVKISVIVLFFTQFLNYVFVPLIGHAGLTLSISIGACMNSLLLVFELRRREIYIPSPGWARFFLQIISASFVLAGLMRWFSLKFDWTSMHTQPIFRIMLVIASLFMFATLYFIMLWAMGFKYANLKKDID